MRTVYYIEHMDSYNLIIIFRAHGLLHRANGLLFREYELLYRAHGLLYRAHGLLFRVHELINHSLGLSSRAYELYIVRTDY